MTIFQITLNILINCDRKFKFKYHVSENWNLHFFFSDMKAYMNKHVRFKVLSLSILCRISIVYYIYIWIYARCKTLYRVQNGRVQNYRSVMCEGCKFLGEGLYGGSILRHLSFKDISPKLKGGVLLLPCYSSVCSHTIQ